MDHWSTPQIDPLSLNLCLKRVDYYYNLLSKLSLNLGLIKASIGLRRLG